MKKRKYYFVLNTNLRRADINIWFFFQSSHRKNRAASKNRIGLTIGEIKKM
jgi:hypothetical protein